MTIAASPTFSPRSSTASFVIEAVMICPDFNPDMGGGHTFFDLYDFPFDLIARTQLHDTPPNDLSLPATSRSHEAGFRDLKP
jgi:hypothetical protein